MRNSLKLQRDKIKQYQRKVSVPSACSKAYTDRQQVQGVLDREKEIAKEALKEGNKPRALTALRRRKYQETLLQKTDSQLESLQNLVRPAASLLPQYMPDGKGKQVSNIEFALVEKDVVFGLQQGNAVLKQLHSEMTLENVEKLMGETHEAIAYQKVCSLHHLLW